MFLKTDKNTPYVYFLYMWPVLWLRKMKDNNKDIKTVINCCYRPSFWTPCTWIWNASDYPNICVALFTLQEVCESKSSENYIQLSQIGRMTILN